MSFHCQHTCMPFLAVVYHSNIDVDSYDLGDYRIINLLLSVMLHARHSTRQQATFFITVNIPAARTTDASAIRNCISTTHLRLVARQHKHKPTRQRWLFLSISTGLRGIDRAVPRFRILFLIGRSYTDQAWAR